jgi:hypothetical protein
MLPEPLTQIFANFDKVSLARSSSVSKIWNVELESIYGPFATTFGS